MKFRLTHPDLLASHRRALGMTIKDVADLSRVDYSKIQDFERSKYKKIDAPILEAVCYALGLHPLQVSDDYEPPSAPRLSYVAVDGRHVAGYLEREGISALELAKRASISHNYVYGPTSYDQQTIPADAARKLAKAMGLRGYELAPVLAIYPSPDGEEMFGDVLSEYGGFTPNEVRPLPTPSNI
jgi:transcriptional regulator with XRE-family HTH domain